MPKSITHCALQWLSVVSFKIFSQFLFTFNFSFYLASLSLIFDFVITHDQIPKGLIPAFTGMLILASLIIQSIKLKLPMSFRIALLGFLLGDLMYAVASYGLKLESLSVITRLSYLMPYYTAMTIVNTYLFKIIRQFLTSNVVISLAGIFLLSFFALCYLIHLPFISQTANPLCYYVIYVSILFSILQCTIIAQCAVLLMMAESRPLQLGLFGLLLMHVSDIALRFRHIQPHIDEISIFEGGWCWGLAFIAKAVCILKQMKPQVLSPTLLKLVPFSSLRGITTGNVLLTTLISSLSLLYYLDLLPNTLLLTRTLLIVTAALGFAVIIANLITSYLASVTKSISRPEFLKSEFTPEKQFAELDEFMSQYFTYLKTQNKEMNEAVSSSVNSAQRLAHDIKSPLAAFASLMEYLNIVESGTPVSYEKLKYYRKLISDAANYIETLSSAFLSENKQKSYHESLEEAITKARVLSQTAYPKLKLDVRLSHPCTPIRVTGLTRHLLNLITNAVEDSGPSCSLILSGYPNKTHYVIEVEDFGSGIPNDVQHFVRAGIPLSHKPMGNGIGLSSLQKWAVLHGISLEFLTDHSKTHQGTRVLLKFPIEKTS
jgi:signal transduction histidine kinase